MKKHRRTIFSLAFALILCCGCATSVVGNHKVGNRIQKVIQEARPAFVFIGGGSGVVISADGFLLTNAHVVQKQKEFQVRLGNGESHHAKLVGLNRNGDLALLKITDADNLQHLAIGESGSMDIGNYCLAIGNPLALGMVDQTPSVSIGVLSTKHLFRGTYNDALVTDAPVNPGNSGGPLLNMDGEIIGVIGQIETRWGLRANTGIGLALSSDQVRRWLPKLKEADGGNVPRGYLHGIQWKAMRAEGQIGAPVQNVAEGSPAASCGLKAGDVIVSVNHLKVWNVPRFRGILRGYPAGSPVTLSVRRGDAIKNISVRLRKPVKPGFKLDVSKVDDEPELIIEEVKENSAAARAGLQEGDVLIAVGKRSLSGKADHKKFTASIILRQMFATGRSIVLTVQRKKNGKDVEKTIKFFPGGE